MAKRMRMQLEDWDEWVRPYVVRRVVVRRKNQYDAGMTESHCYSVDKVPFGLMVLHRVAKHLKWKVEGRCFKCGKVFICSWNNLWLKKRYKGQEVCGKCGRKEQFTDAWKRNNSEAQKRVQGTPEARRRMSRILREDRKSVV